MTPQVPVLVIGDVMTDIVTSLSGPVSLGSDTAAGTRLVGGGSGANTAAWLGAQGHPVTFLGRVGDDALGRDAEAALTDAGVCSAITVDPEAPTGTCVVLVGPDGQRSMLPDTGANARLRPEHLPRELFTAGSHLHLSGYTLLTEGSRAAGRAALDLARAARMTISVDPASSAPLRAVGPARVLEWLTRVDVLFPNDDELHVLTSAADATAPVTAADVGSVLPVEVATWARGLLGVADLVVVTLGAAGALAVGRHVGALPEAIPAASAQVVDTTGAGDAFVAGFLPVWLMAGSCGTPDVRAALAGGTEAAAQAVRRRGGRPRPESGAGGAAERCGGGAGRLG